MRYLSTPRDTRRLPSLRALKIEFAAAPPLEAAASGRHLFAAPDVGLGGLFLVVEGVADGGGNYLFERVRGALERDRGTPSARLLRAVRHGCQALESQALHRFELAGLGLTALLIEEAHAYFAQLPPSQAYVVEEGVARPVPEVPMRGAARIGSAAGRRWEVELDVWRTALRPGSTYVLCTSALADIISSGRVADAARRGPPEAVERLLSQPGWANHETGEVLVVRVREAAALPAHARLFEAVRERRAARSALQTATPSSSPRPRIEAWGLRAQALARRPPLIGRTLGEAQPSVLRPRRPARAWMAAAALTVVLFAAVGWRARIAAVARPSPRAGSFEVPTPAASAPPLAGSTLLSTADSLRSMAVIGGVPYVLDGAGRVLAAAPGAPSLQPPAATSPELDRQLLALLEWNREPLIVDAARTIWRIGQPGQAPRPVALRGAAQWQRPIAFAVYAGNLYVLDAGRAGASGQIWRHVGGPSGFDGEAQAWLASGADVELDTATGFAIDGAIWVARGDGTVLKLSGGRPEPFALPRLAPPILTAGALYTDAGLSSVYVLDSAARRLVRISKEGVLEGQVNEVMPIGEHARGLWVDEAGRRALVLTDRRVQQVPLG